VFWQFIDHGGKDLIINSLKSPIEKIKVKAVFLVCSTSHLGNDVVGKLLFLLQYYGQVIFNMNIIYRNVY